MTVTIPGLGTDDEFTVPVGPGETKILQTTGAGALTAGAARVESQHPLGVSAIFTMYNSGAFLTEAGVGSSTPLSNFVIPVDVSAGFNTGVALFAPEASTVSYTLRRLDGTVAGTTSGPLARRNHLAKFVAGTGGLFPSVSNFTRGTLELSCTTPIAAVVLRQNGLSSTTLPVVNKASSNTDFNLPQIANGGDAAGVNIRTTFIVFNISSTAANVQIDVRKPDSTAFPVTVQGLDSPSLSLAQTDSSPEQSGRLTVTLQPGASAFLQTTGTGAVSVGSAQVSSDVPIGVSGIFTLYNGQTFMTEAGVGDSPVRTDFTLPVDFAAGSSNSIAIFNPNQTPALIDIWLVDEAGAFAGRISAPKLLPGLSQIALQVSDPELFPGKTNFRGTMCGSVTQGEGVAAVTLRTNNDPLSYTTLPVVEGTFEGTIPSAGALLDQTKTGIGATANTVVNAQLPPGFKISGTISGSTVGIVSVVSARSTAAGGQSYFGLADNQTNRYVVVVPAGTYELAICYMPDSLIPLGVPNLNYTVSQTVTVNADVTRNIQVPAVTLGMVMGSVTGIEQTGAEGGFLTFASADGKNGVTAFAIPSLPYSAQVPNGSYIASLALGIGQNFLGFYNIGTVSVNGTTNANFAVPATVQLSGTVTGAPADSSVSVTDTSAAAVTDAVISCATAITGSSTQIAAGGAYQLLVPKDRPLAASVSFLVGTSGGGGFPFPSRTLGSLSANRTEAFNVPALPGLVTISGKVTNNQGQGVAGVDVSAYSSQITGAAQVYYAAGAETNTDGNYTMQVLSGTNYQLTFTPPRPTP